MIYMIGLRIFAISMRSAILSILFILSRTEYSTDVLGRRSDTIFHLRTSQLYRAILRSIWMGVDQRRAAFSNERSCMS